MLSMSISARHEPMDPVLKESPSHEVNLAVRWVSIMSKLAPPSDRQQGSHALLPTLLCRNLVVDLLHSQPGHLFFTLKVTSGIANRYETLHGGAIGSLVEILGCAAIISITGSSTGSVSDINISYISGTPVKEELDLEAHVLKVGNKIAVASVDIRHKVSGKVAAQGRVTMYLNVDSKL
ncbi:hypothetical protein KP509_12G095300 [Ceratopteris richardii]|uniref:Thioesterase domain-containing protein n=1 Tax=Ceratopteris richardii TaxID=49495 RepID=A0A8T2TUN2_CERRI|nr:hypothetical protein KP509_12G095300 [Ceratopteris richardii]